MRRFSESRQGFSGILIPLIGIAVYPPFLRSGLIALQQSVFLQLLAAVAFEVEFPFHLLDHLEIL